MTKYKKKPVIVDAIPWKSGLEDGYIFENSLTGELVGVSTDVQPCKKWWELSKQYPLVGIPAIKRLEGWVKVGPNDMIITGVKGERYPCRIDIFKETYEPV